MHVAEPATKQRLHEMIGELEAEGDPSRRAAAYLNFVRDAAPYLSTISPFLPALAKWAEK
jgi:hypothetical protein